MFSESSEYTKVAEEINSSGAKDLNRSVFESLTNLQGEKLEVADDLMVRVKRVTVKNKKNIIHVVRMKIEGLIGKNNAQSFFDLIEKEQTTPENIKVIFYIDTSLLRSIAPEAFLNLSTISTIHRLQKPNYNTILLYNTFNPVYKEVIEKLQKFMPNFPATTDTKDGVVTELDKELKKLM